MLLGYPDNHPGDTYRMLNLTTKKLLLSRDIVWLGQNWLEWNSQKQQKNPVDLKDDSDSKELEGTTEQTQLVTDEASSLELTGFHHSYADVARTPSPAGNWEEGILEKPFYTPPRPE